MIVKARPFSVTERPRTCGSAPNRRLHKRIAEDDDRRQGFDTGPRRRETSGQSPASRPAAGSRTPTRTPSRCARVRRCRTASASADRRRRDLRTSASPARASRGNRDTTLPSRSTVPRSTLPMRLTSRSGSLYGTACTRVASTTLKIAVLPPMPTASASNATAAKPGDRRRLRTACRRPSRMLSNDARIFIPAVIVKPHAAVTGKKHPKFCGPSTARQQSRSPVGRAVYRSRDEAIGRRRPAAARRPRAGLAGVAHVHARHRDRRERAAPLRPAGAAVAAERSVLVSGARIRDGHGLALLRHHHLGDGRVEARPQPEGARARRLHLRWTRQAVAQHTRRAARDRRAHQSRWRRAGPYQPAHRARGQQRGRRRLSDLSALVHPHAATATGPSCSRG